MTGHIFASSSKIKLMLGALPVSLGVLTLVGWAWDISLLKRGLATSTAMNPATAICIILLGFEAYRLNTGIQALGRVGQIATIIVLIACATKLADIILGTSFAMDAQLFPAKLAAEAGQPNRMAPSTAFCFIALGLSMLLLRRYSFIAQLLALATTFVVLLALIGYIFGIETFYGIGVYVPMASNTVVSFLLLSMAVLFAYPDKGFMPVLINNGPSGSIAAILLPASILVPAIFGWIVHAGVHEFLFDMEFALALSVVLNITMLLILTYIGMYGLYRADIHRQKLETELRESEEHFRKAVEGAPMAIFVQTQECFAYVNEATLDLFGATAKNQLLGKPVLERIHPAYHNVVAARFQLTNENRMAVPLLEEKYLKLDGTVMDVEVNAAPFNFRNENGSIVFVHDITDRKQSEEKINELNLNLEQRVAARTADIKAANKELEDFSYSISHDLRTPLRAIDGYSHILLEDHAGKLDDEGKRMLMVVINSTRRMSLLIDGILHFIRAGRVDMSIAATDMEGVVRDVLGKLQPLISGRRLSININPLPEAFCDRAMIHQVFEGLLSNAIKFSGITEEARIDIGGKIENDEVIYYVNDNGAGFDMLYVDKLFGVFQRLHTEKEFEGTGIGLALVKRIVTRHGGRVWAEGKINEGATIYFALPASSHSYSH